MAALRSCHVLVVVLSTLFLSLASFSVADSRNVDTSADVLMNGDSKRYECPEECKANKEHEARIAALTSEHEQDLALVSEYKARLSALEEALASADSQYKEALSGLEAKLFSSTSGHEKSVTSLEEKASSASMDSDMCRSNLVESETHLNNAIQSLTALEDKHSILHSRHSEREGELDSQISKLQEELKAAKKLQSASQVQVNRAYEELRELQKELKHMHQKAASSGYCNITLMAEDATFYTSTAAEKTVRFLTPILKKCAVAGAMGYDQLMHIASPHLKKTYAAYDKMAAPHIQSAKELYEKHCAPSMKQLKPYFLKGEEAMEGVRLTLISALSQGSKAALNYISAAQDEKLKRDEHHRTSAMVKGLLKGLTYVNNNAEQIVRRTVQAGLAYLFYRSIGYRILRFFWFLLQIPFYLFNRLVKSKKKKRKEQRNEKRKANKEIYGSGGVKIETKGPGRK